MKLHILSENSDFLVVDKPAGLSVHNPLPGEPSLLDLLPKGMHLVHRLDKETSGLVLVAKNSTTTTELMKALEEQGQKLYSALLRGSLPKTDSAQKWTWEISDKAEGRKNPQGQKNDRKKAETLWKVLASNKYLTLIEAQIITGRQHQIRKHTALAGHAIVGDSRYNDPKYNQKMATLYGTSRMFLHAQKLSFIWKQKEWSFTAPLPQEFLVFEQNEVEK